MKDLPKWIIGYIIPLFLDRTTLDAKEPFRVLGAGT